MLGSNIRKTRKLQGLSINKLSELSGVSLGYLSDLENGKMRNPSDKTIESLADALKVTPDYLQGLSIGHIIEQRLNAIDMPLSVLCEKTGFSEKYFIKLDNTIPTQYDYDNLAKIAEALDLPAGPLIAALARQEPPLAANDDEDYEVIDASEVFVKEADGSYTVSPETLQEYGADNMDEHRKTLAALRTDGYDEPLSEDEAAAVKAFLDSYRKMKGDKNE